MVALSASRLVCPAIAWIRPITSPMRVAAARKLRHGLDGALRFGDGAARDLGRGRGLTGDLADRGRKLLGRTCGGCDVHRGGADALLGGARLRRHGVGRAVERGRGRLEPFGGATHLGERLIHRILETQRSSRAMVSVRRSRSRTDFSCVTASCSRSIALSRNTITVRAIAPISSSASVAGMSTAAVARPRASASRLPGCRSGRVMLRRSAS